MQEISSKIKNLDFTKITKYFKNQEPPKDLSGSSFTDSYFPPTINSIKGLDKYGKMIDMVNGEKIKKDAATIPEAVEWKRASAIFNNGYSVFADKIEFDDIAQGSVGNCYFLSTLSSLCMHPELISRLFKTKEVNQSGYYEVALFIDGEWQIVFVDDYFVVYEGTNSFPFAKPNGKELWVIILEKAWAKVNSGYANTFSGHATEAYLCLTGCKSETLIHDAYFADIPLFTNIINSVAENKLMCSASNKDIDETLGIIGAHCYLIVSAHLVNLQSGEQIRLIKLRNPWGKYEWTGDWSDNSVKWTEEITKIINYDTTKAKNDGVFFISFEDYLHFFHSTSTCKFLDENIHSETFSIDKEGLAVPHVFNLNLTEDTDVSLNVLFRTWRFNRDAQNATHPTSLVIASYDSNKMIGNVSGNFKSETDINYKKRLEKGNYVVWIYSALRLSSQPHHSSYVITIDTVGENAKITKVGTDEDFHLIRHIISSGIADIYAEEIENSKNEYYFVKTADNFKDTGLCFFSVLNKRKELKFNWTIDSSPSHDEMVLLPPYGFLGTEHIAPNSFTSIIFMKKDPTQVFNLTHRYGGSELEDSQSQKNVEAQNTITEVLKYYLHCDGSDETNVSSSSQEENFEIIEIKKLNFVMERHMVETVDLNNLKEIKFQPTPKKSLRCDYPKLMKGLKEYNKYGIKIPNTQYALVEFDEGIYCGRVDENKKRHGKGTFLFQDGSYFKGMWKANLPYLGQCTRKDDSILYRYTFDDKGKRGSNSVGDTFFLNGDNYTGNYKDGEFEGYGNFSWKREPNTLHMLSAMWKNGKIVSDVKYNITRNLKLKTSFGYKNTTFKYELRINSEGAITKLRDDSRNSKTYTLEKQTDSAFIYKITDHEPKNDYVNPQIAKYMRKYNYDNLVEPYENEDDLKFEASDIVYCEISQVEKKFSEADVIHLLNNTNKSEFKSKPVKYCTIICKKGTFYGAVDGEGKRHDKGLFEWNDGTIYSGYFVNDKRHVYGFYHIQGKEVFRGPILNGLRGPGCADFSKYTWMNQDHMDCNYVEGRLNGKAVIYFYRSNDLFEYCFKDDHPIGKGKMYQSGFGNVNLEYDENGELIAAERC